MAKKEQGLAVVDEAALAELRAQFPMEAGFQRVLLPRLGMVSQDKFEGKGKAATLVKEAGMFFTEVQTDTLDESGKKTWIKTDLGTEVEGIILYQRKQLRYYDEATQSYTSSPVYDTDEDIVPLFKDRAEVARGTPSELKKAYEYTDPKDNKVKSNLEDNRILYVLCEDTIYQMGLHGSSMYAWLSYARKVTPPAVLTRFSSKARENGAISWNQTEFEVARLLTMEEVQDVLSKVSEIKGGIAAEKNYFASQRPAESSGSAAMDAEVRKF